MYKMSSAIEFYNYTLPKGLDCVKASRHGDILPTLAEITCIWSECLEELLLSYPSLTIEEKNGYGNVLYTEMFDCFISMHHR
jgi:hypothetical protein